MYISTALLPLLAPLTFAAHLRVFIPASTSLPNPSTLPPSTTASLTTLSSIVKAPLRLDNTFDFRNVSTGSYLLDIHCATHAFAPLRVDVHDGSKLEDGHAKVFTNVEVWGTFRGNEWGNKGEVMAVQDVNGDGKIWSFEARAGGAKEYLQERSGFSPLSLLKNPMILIAGVSMVIVFGMPYLMENMDPELKAEFEERQKSSTLGGGPAANPLQNFDAAAWLAGSSTKKSENSAKGVAEERGITR